MVMEYYAAIKNIEDAIWVQTWKDPGTKQDT